MVISPRTGHHVPPQRSLALGVQFGALSESMDLLPALPSRGRRTSAADIARTHTRGTNVKDYAKAECTTPLFTPNSTTHVFPPEDCN